MALPVLETERLILRPFRLDDPVPPAAGSAGCTKRASPARTAALPGDLHDETHLPLWSVSDGQANDRERGGAPDRSCSIEELKRRVVSEERGNYRKVRDPDILLHAMAAIDYAKEIRGFTRS